MYFYRVSLPSYNFIQAVLWLDKFMTSINTKKALRTTGSEQVAPVLLQKENRDKKVGGKGNLMECKNRMTYKIYIGPLWTTTLIVNYV